VKVVFKFAARWADQERLVMLMVLENLVGEGKADGERAARRISVLESFRESIALRGLTNN